MRRVFIACLVLVFAVIAVPASAERFSLSPPVDGRVVKGYDDVGRFDAGHRGVDLESSRGATVRAAAVGRVHFAGRVAGTPTVSIDHGNGWRTTYQPVRANVRTGDEVAAGQSIGTVAAGHCAAGACLHWGLTDGVRYADPLSYLATPVVRLLPRGAEPPTPPAIAAASVTPTGGLPAQGRISSPFGIRRHPITGVVKLHDGVDIAAPCGTPIHAWSSGTVTRAGYHSAYGYRVFVDHGGVVTAYTHLPRVEVRVGSRVAAGEVIGRIGNTGLSTGCHLHWMAWRNGQLVDPLSLID